MERSVEVIDGVGLAEDDMDRFLHVSGDRGSGGQDQSDIWVVLGHPVEEVEAGEAALVAEVEVDHDRFGGRRQAVAQQVAEPFGDGRSAISSMMTTFMDAPSHGVVQSGG
jgi:hypothetical protein